MVDKHTSNPLPSTSAQTKADDERDQLGEKLFEAIYSVFVDNKLNIDPLANELGIEVDAFIELVLDYSEGNKDE